MDLKAPITNSKYLFTCDRTTHELNKDVDCNKSVVSRSNLHIEHSASIVTAQLGCTIVSVYVLVYVYHYCYRE